MSASPDPDLRDVFKLLYADDEDDTWAAFSDDEQPTSDDVIPQTELEQVEEAVIPQDSTERYSRKRFQAEIDSLFTREPTKRQRIYTQGKSPQNTIFPSTLPPPDLPGLGIYAPFSPLPLLARLRTFSPASYPPIPSPLDPVSLALTGWVSTAKGGLRCAQCHARWSVGGLGEIRDERTRKEVVRRLGERRRDQHAVGCPWRVTSSPVELVGKLRGMLHPPMSSSLGILSARLAQECLAYGAVDWVSPLTPAQLEALMRHLSRHSLSYTTSDESPLFAASVMALFGWYPYHPNSSYPASVDLSASSQRTDILSCRICARRVGLWAFKPEKGQGKKFDLKGEHLEWCPLGADAWWEKSGLLRGDGEIAGARTEDVKNWVTISEKMEKKPWRR